MLGNVSPYRPYSKEEIEQRNRTKPSSPPRNDSFKEKVDEDRGSKNSRSDSSEKPKEKDADPPSLFDLQKKDKTKSKPFVKESTTSKEKPTLKGSPSKDKSSVKRDSDSNEPLSNKPLSAKQDLNQTFDEEGEGLDDDMFQQPTEEPLFSESSQEMETPEQELETPEPRTPIEPEKPIRQSQIPDPSIRQQQSSILQQPEKSKRSIKEPVVETKERGPVSKKDKPKTESSSQTSAGQEKGDAALAGVHSNVQGAAFQTDKAQENIETSRSATIRDLANQIIDRIQIMRRDNQTETMVTLRHPPILEGATLTLTASDNAKREFNISFANLSPDAKALLDRKLTEDSLTATLERKGIVVHMVTTTTQAENLLNIDSGQASRDQQEQQQQQQQRQQRFKNPEDEEEA